LNLDNTTLKSTKALTIWLLVLFILMKFSINLYFVYLLFNKDPIEL